MDNPFEEIGHGVEVVAKDIAHVAVEVVEFPVKAEKVLNTIQTNWPVLKPEFTTLLADGAALAATTTAVFTGPSVTLAVDEWNEIQKVIADVKAAVATTESFYASVNTDVE